MFADFVKQNCRQVKMRLMENENYLMFKKIHGSLQSYFEIVMLTVSLNIQ
jgi:hypothetical protein